MNRRVPLSNTWSKLKFWRTTYQKMRIPENSLPPEKERFRAFELTDRGDVNVCIIGQDPYHTKGMACGLAFSVQPHITNLPPTLRNILREYSEDTGYGMPKNGSLERWAQNGVLLLNTILTVCEGKPLNHEGIGWERLTYEVLRTLSLERDGIVFMLWGKKAQEYRALIDESKHLVLTAPHPSPLAGKSGRPQFKGCKHFTLANEYRKKRGLEPINWRL